MKNYIHEVVYIGIDVHKKNYAVPAVCNGIAVKSDTLSAFRNN